MKFGKRKLNMAALRGTKQAIADINRRAEPSGTLSADGKNQLWDEVMPGVPLEGHLGELDRLLNEYQHAYWDRRELIKNCKHDFGDRARSWGVDDRATCQHCGIAVASGGLLDLDIN